MGPALTTGQFSPKGQGVPRPTNIYPELFHFRAFSVFGVLLEEAEFMQSLPFGKVCLSLRHIRWVRFHFSVYLEKPSSLHAGILRTSVSILNSYFELEKCEF